MTDTADKITLEPKCAACGETMDAHLTIDPKCLVYVATRPPISSPVAGELASVVALLRHESEQEYAANCTGEVALKAAALAIEGGKCTEFLTTCIGCGQNIGAKPYVVDVNGETGCPACFSDDGSGECWKATHQGQRAAALDWQPIESAPKDGTRVIVAKIDWMHANLKDTFNGEPKDKYSVWWVSQAQFDQKREKWNDGLESLVPPTHWLPLSTPAPHAGPQGCEVPPPGWYCTRAAGHEGPCAAIEVSRALKELEG